MTVLAFTGLVCAGSFVAGLVGSLTGLGGGVVIVPLLVLMFGVDIRYAIGASLVSVIAMLRVVETKWLRQTFAWVIVLLALEMLYHGLTGKL